MCPDFPQPALVAGYVIHHCPTCGQTYKPLEAS